MDTDKVSIVETVACALECTIVQRGVSSCAIIWHGLGSELLDLRTGACPPGACNVLCLVQCVLNLVGCVLCAVCCVCGKKLQLLRVRPWLVGDMSSYVVKLIPWHKVLVCVAFGV